MTRPHRNDDTTQDGAQVMPHTKIDLSRKLLLAFLLVIPAQAFAQSGDPVVDSHLVPYYEHRRSSSAPPSALSPTNYGSGSALLGCASSSAPSHETNCPSDLTYTPNANTGGYQAFGVGIHNIPYSEQWITECYILETWEWDWEAGTWVLTFYYWCDTYLYVTRAEVSGFAISRIKWGATYATIPNASTPLSTLAFKGTNLANCNPKPGVIAEAPCLSNGTYVPSAGYEDKIIIPDNCPRAERTGLATDFTDGCFWSQQGLWMSDMPAAYQDTTAADRGDQFVISVGTASAASLNEGTMYTNRTWFGQLGTETIRPGPVRHTGSVTVPRSLAPFCLLYQSTFGQAACMFNVDQVQITPPLSW
jgi:hypothetical protein